MTDTECARFSELKRRRAAAITRLILVLRHYLDRMPLFVATAIEEAIRDVEDAE